MLSSFLFSFLLILNVTAADSGATSPESEPAELKTISLVFPGAYETSYKNLEVNPADGEAFKKAITEIFSNPSENEGLESLSFYDWRDINEGHIQTLAEVLKEHKFVEEGADLFPKLSSINFGACGINDRKISIFRHLLTIPGIIINLSNNPGISPYYANTLKFAIKAEERWEEADDEEISQLLARFYCH